jgi:hypothetical protein
VSIACDGRVSGATLEVTHWNGNKTPESLYADTSTEMALKLARQDQNGDEFRNVWDAVVLNNHYDTDGVCSVWACLEPELALEYEDILIAAAEAGDFGEWSSDVGVKLDLTLLNLSQSDEETAYTDALSRLPAILEDLKESGGQKNKHLWKDGWERAVGEWEDIRQDRVKLYRAGDQMVVVEETGPKSRTSPYALDRGMREKNLWSGTTRILRVNPFDVNSNNFVYEKIGHGWVSKLVDRHMVPGSDVDPLVASLNENCQGSSWFAGGPSGLLAICQTKTGVSMSVEEMATLVGRLDAQG